MYDACNDISADQCQAWIRHARRVFPRCLANKNIHCDVDENLWPNPHDRVDGNIDADSAVRNTSVYSAVLFF